MTNIATLDPLAVRRVLGRRQWGPPVQMFPPEEMWGYRAVDGDGSVVVSLAVHDGAEWLHASMTRRDSVPSYEDLCLLHRAVFGERWAYQVFAPPADHININECALHLWGRADGMPAMPNFGRFGTI